jgi:hypothetical protein
VSQQTTLREDIAGEAAMSQAETGSVGPEDVPAPDSTQTVESASARQAKKATAVAVLAFVLGLYELIAGFG